VRLWDRYEPLKEWTRYVQHSSTEDRLALVIRRRHRELYRHQRCPYTGCDQHPEPLTELPLVGSDNRK